MAVLIRLIGRLSVKSGRICILCLLCILISVDLSAQVSKHGKKISPDLFGLFFEDINYSADGGLYAELVQNRSFEYNPTERGDWNPFSYWEYQTPGFSYGRISVESSSPVHPNNPHYLVLDIEHVGHEAQYQGESGVGIRNSGFDGMVVRAPTNTPYPCLHGGYQMNLSGLQPVCNPGKGKFWLNATFPFPPVNGQNTLQTLSHLRTTTVRPC